MEPAALSARPDGPDLATVVCLQIEDGDLDAAASSIAAASLTDLDRIDPAELKAILKRLDVVLERHPLALLAYCRLLELTVHIEERGRLLARLERLAAATGDAVFAREVAAERARDLARDGEIDRAMELAGEVLAAATPSEGATRARALGALGRVFSFRRAPGDAVRAVDALREAAALCRQLGDAMGEAQALIWLGYGVLLPEGRDDRALEALRRARLVAPTGSALHRLATTFLAGCLLAAGMADEAEALLDEAEQEAAVRDDSRLLGYIAWDRAEVAALRNDPVALAVRLGAVELYQAEWFEHPTGAEFLAEAAEMAQRVGDQALAEAYLGRAEGRAREHGHPEIAAAARAGHEARFGDPVLAGRLLRDCADHPQVARRDRWRLDALRAVAADRGGNDEEARAAAALAVEEAVALGLGHFLAVREPVIARRVLELAAAGGSKSARALLAKLPAPSSVVIELLGRFTVVVDGEERTPWGQPATLVKLLALNGGAMPAEEVIESLWPEQDRDTGRRRLRNLLHRLGAMSGRLVVRRGELLRIPGAVVDVAAVDAELRTAEAGGAAAPGAARRALAMATGPFLPDDPYAEWAVHHRERLHHRLARAGDLLAAEARASGDAAAALQWTERAFEFQPWDLERHRHVVEAALSAGDRRQARWLAERAVEAHRALGIEAPRTITSLLDD